MSQRIGMADGRCITEVDSNRIMFDYLKTQSHFGIYDNNKYRMYLQEKGPDAFNLPIQNAACRESCGMKLMSPLAERQ